MCGWCFRMKQVSVGSISPSTAGVKKGYAQVCPVTISGSITMPLERWNHWQETVSFWCFPSVIRSAWTNFYKICPRHTQMMSFCCVATEQHGTNLAHCVSRKISSCSTSRPIRRRWTLSNRFGKKSARGGSAMKCLLHWTKLWTGFAIPSVPSQTRLFPVSLAESGFLNVLIKN